MHVVVVYPPPDVQDTYKILWLETHIYVFASDHSAVRKDNKRFEKKPASQSGNAACSQ